MQKHWRMFGFAIIGLVLLYFIGLIVYSLYTNRGLVSFECFNNPACVARNVGRALLR